MNNPTLTFTANDSCDKKPIKVEVKYKQIPYDNRYFIIKIEGKKIMKVAFNISSNIDKNFIPYDNYLKDEKWNKFMKKCGKYNDYLDKGE